MFRQDFTCPALLEDRIRLTRTGLSPAVARLSRRFRLSLRDHWPGPRSLATTCGVSVDVLSSGYLDVSVRRVRFACLCIQQAIPPKRWVAPFGNPRIKACSRLPMAYRNVLRPSSPLSAKASTRCPSYACSHNYECATRRRKPTRNQPPARRRIRQRCIIMTQPTVSPLLRRRPCRVILGHLFSSHVKDPIPASADTCFLSPRISRSQVVKVTVRHRPPPGGGGRDRTDDLMLAQHALSPLSYAPHGEGSAGTVVGQGRLELPTSRLSSARSNQLSY